MKKSKLRSTLLRGIIALLVTSVLLAYVNCNSRRSDTDTKGSNGVAAVECTPDTVTSTVTTTTTTNRPTTTSTVTTTTTSTNTSTTTTETTTTTVVTEIVTTSAADVSDQTQNCVDFADTSSETCSELQNENDFALESANVVEAPQEVYYFQGTFYTATAMGYTSPPYGASGAVLTSGYSVASNYFAYGTIIHVESDYISGDFIVQDCGGMAYNVVDFYYWDSSNVPSAFRQAGRIAITVTVVG